jgi:hypothetical protein
MRHSGGSIAAEPGPLSANELPSFERVIVFRHYKLQSLNSKAGLMQKTLRMHFINKNQICKI